MPAVLWEPKFINPLLDEVQKVWWCPGDTEQSQLLLNNMNPDYWQHTRDTYFLKKWIFFGKFEWRLRYGSRSVKLFKFWNLHAKKRIGNKVKTLIYE